MKTILLYLFFILYINNFQSKFNQFQRELVCEFFLVQVKDIILSRPDRTGFQRFFLFSNCPSLDSLACGRYSRYVATRANSAQSEINKYLNVRSLKSFIFMMEVFFLFLLEKIRKANKYVSFRSDITKCLLLVNEKNTLDLFVLSSIDRNRVSFIFVLSLKNRGRT